MFKKSWATAKLNLKTLKVPYIVTAIVFATLFIQSLIYMIVALSSSNAGYRMDISSGNFLWLLVILAAIFIPGVNFRRIINLGGKRDGFFWGSLIALALLSAIVTVLNTAFFYSFEYILKSTEYYIGYNEFMQNTSLINNHYVIINLIELFGWGEHGIFVVVLQQFAFLFLLAVIVYTITAIQGKWYGWVTDIAIAAVLGTFIPIASLRSSLLWLFNMTIFNPIYLMQIVTCIILATAVYSLNKTIFAKKEI